MKNRVISGVVIGLIILSTALIQMVKPDTITIFVTIICGLIAKEVLSTTKTLRNYELSIPSFAFVIIYPLSIYLYKETVVLELYTIIALMTIVLKHKDIDFSKFAYSYSILIITTIALSSMIRTQQIAMDLIDPQTQEIILNHMKSTKIKINYSSLFFIITMCTPWFADTGAFFVGKKWGKKFLCPEISPKKTVEGAIGGIITSTIMVPILVWFILHILMHNVLHHSDVNMNYLILVVMVFIGSILSIFGDLSFSVIKRHFHKKDYSNLIPGHGGILDRFDSVIMVAPFVYIITLWFPIIYK